MSEIFSEERLRVASLGNEIGFLLDDDQRFLTHDQATTLAHAILAHVQEQEKKK